MIGGQICGGDFTCINAPGKKACRTTHMAKHDNIESRAMPLPLCIFLRCLLSSCRLIPEAARDHQHFIRQWPPCCLLHFRCFQRGEFSLIILRQICLMGYLFMLRCSARNCMFKGNTVICTTTTVALHKSSWCNFIH